MEEGFKDFTDKIVEKFGIASNQTIPTVVDLKLEQFEKGASLRVTGRSVT